jgi:hypothetical protein
MPAQWDAIDARTFRNYDRDTELNCPKVILFLRLSGSFLVRAMQPVRERI